MGWFGWFIIGVIAGNAILFGARVLIDRIERRRKK